MAYEENAEDIALRIKYQLMERHKRPADVVRETGMSFSDVSHTINFQRPPNPVVVKYLRELGIDFPDVKRIKRVVVCA